jgi:hypothetical protein
MGRFAWIRVLSENRRIIFKLVREASAVWYRPQLRSGKEFNPDPEVLHPN